MYHVAYCTLYHPDKSLSRDLTYHSEESQSCQLHRRQHSLHNRSPETRAVYPVHVTMPTPAAAHATLHAKVMVLITVLCCADTVHVRGRIEVVLCLFLNEMFWVTCTPPHPPPPQKKRKA